MTVWQFVGRYNHAVRTGCVDCREVIITESSDPEAMRQAFAERGPPEAPEHED